MDETSEELPNITIGIDLLGADPINSKKKAEKNCAFRKFIGRPAAANFGRKTFTGNEKSNFVSRSFNTGNISSQPEFSAAAITLRQNNSVVVAQEKTASFLQSVFSNCTVHGSVNTILINQNR